MQDSDKSRPESSTTPIAAKWQGAWGTKDIQAALAKDREKRGVVVQAAQQPASPTQAAVHSEVTFTFVEELVDLDDPSHPYFDVTSYLSPVINKYICPKLGCGKYYDNEAAITRHLSSPAHGEKSYQCPKCSRIFKTVEAIAYHTGSPGDCQIDQVAGEIVQFDTQAGDNPLEYNVQKDAVEKVFW